MKYKIFTLAVCAIVSLSVFAQTNHIQLIRQQLLLQGLSFSDVEELIITHESVSKHNGMTHVYFRQKIKGIEVYNAVGAIHLKNDQVVFASQNFVKDIAAKITATKPTVAVNQAISATAKFLNLKEPSALAKTAMVLTDNRVSIREVTVSPEPIKVQLYYYSINNEVKLVYNTNWLDGETNNWWNVRVDANNGSIVDQNNWTLNCNNHSHKNNWYEQKQTTGLNQPTMVHGAKKASGQGKYHALPLGVESPLHGQRKLIENPADAVASPFGWHDTNGQEGAEETITAGNNVFAGEDIDNLDIAGYSPDGGDSLVFDYPYDTAASPDYNLDAVITNLFVWNNYMHDVMYHYGFDEISGNFQMNNYNNGGEDNDEVRADAQDGSGMNNANFATPEDGQSPRMQMYLWSGNLPYFSFSNGTFTDSTTYFTSAFGLRRFDKISGQLVLARLADTSNLSLLGCGPLLPATGKIVVIDRGTCSFVAKVKAAQNAGATAAVVINNSNAPIMAMTGNDISITIPSIMISKAKGDKLKQWLASGEANGVINKNRLDRALDSDMDNGVIAHEYGHGISNRLTGGPGMANCLTNQEQAGEGWSDFFCLYMTHSETGLAGHARGIGTWLDNEPVTGIGIRTFRYSTDMSMNPFTYNSIKTASVPHGVGSVWCTMLYDLYWNMIDKYGYDSNLYSGNGGNNRTLQLVMDGLKLQPCAPGFVDARNAIILADKMNNNGADSALIWSTFARRGLGYSAKQGLSSSRTDGTEAFDMPSPNSGLSELNQMSNISFWPNPNNGTFQMLLPDNASNVFVTICDISGRVVYQKILRGHETVQIETSGLQNGLYLIKAEANGASYANKLMIAH